jgi:uncharacterized protein
MALYLKCIPNAFYQSIYEIPYQDLKEQGINTLFFDLDNTIISYDDKSIGKKDCAFLKALEKDFKILIISNSNRKRVTHALSDCGFPMIWRGKKPLKIEFKKALRTLDSTHKTTAVIGDQMMTDILGANRMKLYSILVTPIKRKSDIWMTKINRFFEKIILKKIEKKEPNLYAERLEAYVNNQ